MTMGEMCLKEQRTEDGLAFLAEAAALSPDNTGLRWRLYNLYMKQGRIDEALRYFLEIVALEPDNDDLKYRLADFYRKHQKREEALPIYKALAEKYPREPKPHIMWSELLMEMGHMEEGQRLKELAKLLSYGLKANPDHKETVAFMNYLFSIGRHAEAYEWLERGLAKWPYHGELVMLKVKILYNEYQYKEAVTLLKRLISVRPDVPEPHVWIAMCYQRLGDNMAALAEAKLCTRLAPKSYVAHKVLGDVLKEQRKLSQANAAYEVAEMMRQKR
jgi:tetratricopeptide (TPR) repeat protein